MKVIGLTGNIGSGKSTVAGLFKELGAEIIDADQIARDVVRQGKPALKEIAELFGKDVLNSDGTLNRKYMADIVFSNDEKREQLNNIIHPKIYDKITGSIKNYSKKGAGIVIIEAALILEKKGLLKLIESLIVVSISRETQVKRLRSRGDLSAEQISARIKSQLSNSEKIKHADYIIDNNGKLENTREQVRQIWNNLT